LKRTFDLVFLVLGIGMIGLFTTRYCMPFRLDDVLLMQWANAHSVWDAFDPIKGQMINSFRPVFSLTAYLLTHLAGWSHPFWWHLTLDVSLVAAIAFTGLTARYLAGRWYALEISVLLYFIAFLPILNIFFWYSDLTFGLELAFTASAWYFGLRGLYEARLRFWAVAIALGTLAVLSKEPAFVLVHAVLLGSFLLERNRIAAVWNEKARSKKGMAIALYLILLALTGWVAFVSPTKANRFFSFSSPDLSYFIRDRIEYYSTAYFSITARMVLCFPIVYSLLQRFVKKSGFRMELASREVLAWSFMSVIALVFALVLFQNVAVGVPLLVFIFILNATLEGPERRRARALLPFVACVAVAIAALLVTIQLVKTQLTEAALLTTVLSSWAWCLWIEDAGRAFGPYRFSPLVRWTSFAVGTIILATVCIGVFPRIQREERLLREVRDVRQNANRAVEWSAQNLPKNSLLAVTDYGLYGFDGPGALTAKDDETKLAEQYTFAGGFVFDALGVLGRNDFRRTFLSDSVVVREVLRAMRAAPNSYLFLQSKLDFDEFHGDRARKPLFEPSDHLVARFDRGPYPAEIWKLSH